MTPSAGYMIPRTSAEDLRTSLQIQSQAIDRISRASVESFRYAAGYLKLRYQTVCINQPRYYAVIRLILIDKISAVDQNFSPTILFENSRLNKIKNLQLSKS